MGTIRMIPEAGFARSDSQVFERSFSAVEHRIWSANLRIDPDQLSRTEALIHDGRQHRDES